jgi:hypothetical protein
LRSEIELDDESRTPGQICQRVLLTGSREKGRWSKYLKAKISTVLQGLGGKEWVVEIWSSRIVAYRGECADEKSIDGSDRG